MSPCASRKLYHFANYTINEKITNKIVFAGALGLPPASGKPSLNSVERMSEHTNLTASYIQKRTECRARGIAQRVSVYVLQYMMQRELKRRYNGGLTFRPKMDHHLYI